MEQFLEFSLEKLQFWLDSSALRQATPTCVTTLCKCFSPTMGERRPCECCRAQRPSTHWTSTREDSLIDACVGFAYAPHGHAGVSTRPSAAFLTLCEAWFGALRSVPDEESFPPAAPISIARPASAERKWGN